MYIFRWKLFPYSQSAHCMAAFCSIGCTCGYQTSDQFKKHLITDFCCVTLTTIQTTLFPVQNSANHKIYEKHETQLNERGLDYIILKQRKPHFKYTQNWEKRCFHWEYEAILDDRTAPQLHVALILLAQKQIHGASFKLQNFTQTITHYISWYN